MKRPPLVPFAVAWLPAGLPTSGRPVQPSWPRVTESANEEHRAGGVMHDLVRDAAEEQAPPLGHATGTHHDEVRVRDAGDLDDLLGRAPRARPADLTLRVDSGLT